ncbi:RNA polymerase sigma factor [Micromonospora wenchangensis]|uniref:RNA polymerase sigma factor n=1 Tax=Micromonospora wenchangensis TaxID=1185415 RepID=UPI00343E761C
MFDEIKTNHLCTSSDLDTFIRDNYALVMWGLVATGATQDEADSATLHAMIIAEQQWPLESPKAFVRTVARRTWINSVRRAEADRKRQDKLVAQYDRSPAPAADKKVVFDAEVRYVLSLLAQLPERQRQVMALKVDGLSDEEIAKVTGQKAATVRSNLRHARIKLQQMIRDRKE